MGSRGCVSALQCIRCGAKVIVVDWSSSGAEFTQLNRAGRRRRVCQQRRLNDTAALPCCSLTFSRLCFTYSVFIRCCRVPIVLSSGLQGLYLGKTRATFIVSAARGDCSNKSQDARKVGDGWRQWIFFLSFFTEQNLGTPSRVTCLLIV